MKQLDFPEMGMSMSDYLIVSKNTRVTRKAKQRFLSGEINLAQKPAKRAKKDDKEHSQTTILPRLETSTFLSLKPPPGFHSVRINSFPKYCLPNYMKTIQSHRDMNQIQTTKLVNNKKTQGWIIECLGDRSKLVNQNQKLIGLQEPAYYQLDYRGFCEMFEKEVGELRQEEKLSVFNEFKLVEDEYVYWPVAAFQSLNFDSIENVRQDLLTKRCRDDRVKVNFAPKNQNLCGSQNRSEFQEPSQMLEEVMPIIVQNSEEVGSNIRSPPTMMEEAVVVQESQQIRNDTSQKQTQPFYSQRPAESNGSEKGPQQQRVEHKQAQLKQESAREKSAQPTEEVPRVQTVVCRRTMEGEIFHTDVLVWFTGTNVYKFVHVNDLIHFNEISPSQAMRFFHQTRLSAIQEDIFEFVNLVNTSVKKYDHSDLKHQEKRNFIHRLAKKKGEENSHTYLILRHKQSKQSREVLLLDLQEATTSWQNPQSLVVCYLLPKFNKKELKILRILPLVPYQVRQDYIIELLLKNSDNSTPNYYGIFNTFFQQNSRVQTLGEPRCANCHYRISRTTEKSLQCYFCHSVYHSDCDEEKRHFMFEGCKDKFFWCCFNCVPCEVCFINIQKKDLVECMTCKNHFHQKCGINKNSAAKFECEDCLKCDLCLKKLANCSEECFVEDSSIYCQKCVKLLGRGDYCRVCKGTQRQQSKSQWTKCDKCSGWIHKSCDETLKSNFKYFTQSNVEYHCPFCRDLLKRSYITQLINILIKFDDFGYFTPPVPETLLDYKDIIAEPMCFQEMIRRCQAGLYDNNSFQAVQRDVKLIVSNAMEYNMPKDHCHYSARVLNIMSIQFFNFFKQFFQMNDMRLISDKGIGQSIIQTQKRLFKHIYEHYLEIILNYGSSKSHVNIKMKPVQPAQPPIFRSRELLNLFKSCQVSITFKKDEPLIDHLFSLPKFFQPKKLPITYPICYYHNEPNIISTCQICLQSYCCIKECLLHHQCLQCGQMGCKCDSWGCGCPPGINQRDLDHHSLRQYKHDILTITHMYKYCIRCSIEKIQSRKCKYCSMVCTYSYTTCHQCKRQFHNFCKNKEEYVVPGLCGECENQPCNMLKKKEVLHMETRKILNRLDRVQKFLPMAALVYANEGINLQLIQIRKLLCDNYHLIEEYLYEMELYEQSGDDLNSLKMVEENIEADKKAVQAQIQAIVERNRQKLSQEQKWELELLMFGLSYHVGTTIIPRKDFAFADNLSTRAQQLHCKIDQCFAKFSAYLYLNPPEMDEEIPPYEFLPVTVTKIRPPFVRQINKLNNFLLRCKSNCLLFGEKKPAFFCQEKLKQSQTNQKLITKLRTLNKAAARGALIDIYNSMKSYSRTGSTCLINLKKNSIEVYKKWSNKQGIWINLWKESGQWKLKINEKLVLLKDFAGLVTEVRRLCGGERSTIYSLDGVARFLGFHIYEADGTNYTYTTFLQTHPMESGDRRSGVLNAFESLKISKVEKKELFFMKKKNDGKEEQQENKSSPPYFLFEELRRELEDQPFAEKHQLKKSEPSKQIFIAPSTIHKLGLFSTKFQKKNTVLIEYMGEILSMPMADLRQSLYHLGCYMFGVPKKLDQNIKTNQDPTYDSSTPHINNSKRDVIDATFRGNQARYLNHSCDPNCASIIQEIDGAPRILIYAIRDIQPFEELTYDYQFKVTAGEKIICTCKAKNCQGRLN